MPFRQHLSRYGREDEWIHTRKALAVRTSVDPLTLIRAIEDAVKHVDPDQAAHDFMTMDRRVASSPSVSNSRFFASLFSAFGTLAIVLAMVGVYGVMSWVVGQRTTEFGIRMALGARARDVVLMLLGQSLRPIVLGVALGVLGGFGLSRALNSVFWRLTVADPIVLAGISAVMLAAGCSPRGPRSIGLPKSIRSARCGRYRGVAVRRERPGMACAPPSPALRTVKVRRYCAAPVPTCFNALLRT